MSKAIRIMLIVVAVLCVPAIIFPDMGFGGGAASPAALMMICGLAAIFWPSTKKDKEEELS